MKTQNSIIATITIVTIAFMALLTSFTASANVYENRLKEAFDDIISAVSFPFSDKEPQQMHNIYSNPETGIKEGQLDMYKFTIDRESIDLINNAKKVYEEVNGNDNADVYTLWINDNGEWNTQGYRIYYNPDETIVVGMACDHCYTVGFVAPDNKQHRTTYTLEWSTPDDYSDSISGRIITTYAPIKAKSVSNGSKQSTVVINTDNLDKLMEQMQSEGMVKYQKELEMVQKKLKKTQARLDDALSKLQNKSSTFSSSFSSSSSSSGSSHVIKGKVTDSNGEPLIGATIQSIGPLGPGNGVATDWSGEFSLTVPDNATQLKVSYVGYKTQVVPIEPNIVITMKEDEQQMNELSDLFLRNKPRTNSLSESDKNDSQSWMKKLLFYVEKIQQTSENRYLYLTKLYELCKDTEGLDQMDLKIAAKQLESVYRQLKDKKKLKENELIFLESMVDLLHSKIKN